MQIDTLRPLSARKTGGATTVPPIGGGVTVASVTSDNNDATYVSFPLANSGNNWSVRMESHIPPAAHERHRIRGRVRIQTNTGTASENIDLGRDTADAIAFTQIPATSVLTEIAGNWTFAPGFALDDPGMISDFNMGGGYPAFSAGGMSTLITTEVFLDVDCRREALFDAEVRDAAGVNQNFGTVSDTTQPTFWFGTPVYDGLPAFRWTLQLSGPGGFTWDTEGFGAPPESVQMPFGLDDGNYTATFNVSSTIRDGEELVSVEVPQFTVSNITPSPSPPLLSVEQEGEGYRLTWEYPGGQTWDDDYVITEIQRDDCGGSARIATIPDGLNGSYLDTNLPQVDGLIAPDGAGNCVVHSGSCDITYRVRYWGYISTIVTLPTTVPVALVIAWPGQASAIPSGWLRVTELDGYHPRGATGTGIPVATGGAASHTHTTPSHTHSIPAHRHLITGSSENSNDSTTTKRYEGADRAISNQPHNHSVPTNTSEASASTSGAASAGTNAVSNDPASRQVIWIRSDGSATQYPVGALAWSAQGVAGWTKDSLTAGRYLKGAPAAGNGGALIGSSTHSHTVNSHTHTGGTHDHADMTSGLSAAASTEGSVGFTGTTPRWIGRHTHNVNPVSSGVGTLAASFAGTSGTSNAEPPHRRLNVLRNVNGGLQTRIIGLYTGAIGSLPAGLTYCNGGNGTPDMRGLFARDIGSNSVNTTGGGSTHGHSVPSHVHPGTTHGHILSFQQSTGVSYARDLSSGSPGSLGNVAVATHVHDDGSTNATPLLPGPGGSGSTGPSANIPVYREAHFVRLDGTVNGGSLPTPEQRTTDYATITVPALDNADNLDRLSVLGEPALAVATNRSSNLPRLVIESIPIDGGLHTISATEPNEELGLTIAVVGKDQIDALEAILSAERVYWAPVGGTPGWFAPSSWTVTPPTAEVKVLTIVMVRQHWPAVPDPVTLL